MTSCTGGNDWNEIKVNTKEINYALLIGQLDHNDSNARTHGTRYIFNTLGNSDIEASKGNENSFNPKVNNEYGFPRTCFDNDSDFNEYGLGGNTRFTVKEIEHGEQRSTGGATWDAITASENSSLWITKHSSDLWHDDEGGSHRGQSLSFVASNNDGMAMGALMSGFWHKGMPIFGYDGNADALLSIAKGELTGTVEADTSSQCAAVYMLIRNVLAWNKGDEKFKSIDDVLKYGFCHTEGSETIHYDSAYGYVPKLMNNKAEEGTPEYSLMSYSQSITLKGNGGQRDIMDFVSKDESGKFTPLSASDRFDIDNKDGQIHGVDGEKPMKIYQSYYSNTDTYLLSSVKPLFDHLGKTDLFNVSPDSYVSFGNGNDEVSSFNELDNQLQIKDYDAFIINMVKQDSAERYLEKIYNAYKNDKGIVMQPVIFFNRQPLDREIMKKAVDEGKFRFVYYVGMDAVQGGYIQGEMIQQYLCNKYVKAHKENK